MAPLASSAIGHASRNSTMINSRMKTSFSKNQKKIKGARSGSGILTAGTAQSVRSGSRDNNPSCSNTADQYVY